MDQTFLRGRTSPSKLQMLGAASKLEQAAKVIAQEARIIREYLNEFPANDMFNAYSTRNKEVTEPMAKINLHMQGLEDIFNQLAGQPK